MAQAVVVALAFATVVAAQSTTSSVISNIDLSKPFATREAWRFVATQGPPIDGDDTASGDEEPGQIQLCLRASASAPCDPQLLNALRTPLYANDSFSKPHYLKTVKIVYPHGNTYEPVLFVQTGSLHSGDGDQLVLTQTLAYQNSQDRFLRIYQYTTGTNNNQEVRYISSERPRRGCVCCYGFRRMVRLSFYA